MSDSLDGSGDERTVRSLEFDVDESSVPVRFDVDERKQRERALVEQPSSDRFLSELSRVLATSLDEPPPLNEIARLGVPCLGNCCVIVVGEDQTNSCDVVVADVDWQREQFLRRSWRELRSDLTFASAIPSRLGPGGEPRVFNAIDELLATHISHEERIRTLTIRGLSRVVFLPLVAREHILGCLLFLVGRTDRAYGESEILLGSEIARRIAVAIDNHRLFREAQDAIRLRDRVLSTVSHDLRNPLMTIRLLAESTKRRLWERPALTLGDFAERFERIEQSTRQMTTQIDEIIDVVQLQFGQKLTLIYRPTDLVRLAQSLVDEFQHTTDRHVFRLIASRTELLGYWDKDRLQRVVGNLLSNAIKYSAEGGEIIVRLAEESLDGRVWAVLCVEDHGVGIPRAELPRLFGWFFRATNVAATIAGAGIGLAGAREILDRHGGTIHVESEEGRGSTFTVRLPLNGPAERFN